MDGSIAYSIDRSIYQSLITVSKLALGIAHAVQTRDVINVPLDRDGPVPRFVCMCVAGWFRRCLLWGVGCRWCTGRCGSERAVVVVVTVLVTLEPRGGNALPIYS